jgi:hypothetical protein
MAWVSVGAKDGEVIIKFIDDGSYKLKNVCEDFGVQNVKIELGFISQRRRLI